MPQHPKSTDVPKDSNPVYNDPGTYNRVPSRDNILSRGIYVNNALQNLVHFVKENFIGQSNDERS